MKPAIADFRIRAEETLPRAKHPLAAAFLVGLCLLSAAPVARAQAEPVEVHLSHPGDQALDQVFTVRVEGYLPAGEQERTYLRQGVQTRDTLRTPDWELNGDFGRTGPIAVIGDAERVANGDRYFVTGHFRCTATGGARVDFAGRVDYQVVAGGGVLRFGDIPFKLGGRDFQCTAASAGGGTTAVVTPPLASVGDCDPKVLQTEYGTFVGRIWREPGTDPMPIPRSMVIRSEVVNTFRSDRYQGSAWDLSGDLWEMAGSGVEPRHADGGHHPWLYVGTPDHPYRDAATFQCAKADVAAMAHRMTIRWPNREDVNAPLREATLTCWLPPFKCTQRRGDRE